MVLERKMSEQRRLDSEKCTQGRPCPRSESQSRRNRGLSSLNPKMGTVGWIWKLHFSSRILPPAPQGTRGLQAEPQSHTERTAPNGLHLASEGRWDNFLVLHTVNAFYKSSLLNQNVWAEMQLKEQILNRPSHTSPWGLSALKCSTGSHQDCHHSKIRATPACLFPKDAKVQQDSGTQRCQAQGCGDEPKPCPSSLPSPGCRASGSPLDCSYGNGRDHLKQHGLREMEYWFPKVCCKAQCEKAAPTPSHTAPRAPHMHTRTQKRPAGLPQCTGKSCFQSLLVFELVGEPVEAFKEPITAGGTSGLDVPVPLAEGM